MTLAQDELEFLSAWAREEWEPACYQLPAHRLQLAHSVSGKQLVALIKAWTKSQGKKDQDILSAAVNPQPRWPWPTNEVFGDRLAEARIDCMGTFERYDLEEHRHRFAVWAAARSSQRGFTNVKELRSALEGTDIRVAISEPETLRARSSEFETLHRRWCVSICMTLNDRGIRNVTYGRAAKLVAVYLKTMVIVGGRADTPLGHSIHPPVDRTLLQKLATSSCISSPYQRGWRDISWTKLVESDYYTLVEQLREVVPRHLPFWMLEKYWNAEVDD